jgi:hypothetical protein
MILNITDKDNLLNNFLIPVSKVADSAVLNITPGNITTLIATNDNTIIVNASFNDEAITITKILNVPDIKKFCRILSCIEEATISLNVEGNNIGYSAAAIRFKYHLYEDNIISQPKINIEKLPNAEGDVNSTFASKQYLEELIGPRKFVGLEKGIHETVKWATTFHEKNKLAIWI